MAADLAHGHAAGVHRNDLVVEIRKPASIPGNQLRIKRAGTVTRNRQGHLRCCRQNRLLRIAIPVIGSAADGLGLKMLVQLGVQYPFR